MRPASRGSARRRPHARVRPGAAGRTSLPTPRADRPHPAPRGHRRRVILAADTVRGYLADIRPPSGKHRVRRITGWRHRRSEGIGRCGRHDVHDAGPPIPRSADRPARPVEDSDPGHRSREDPDAGRGQRRARASTGHPRSHEVDWAGRARRQDGHGSASSVGQAARGGQRRRRDRRRDEPDPLRGSIRVRRIGRQHRRRSDARRLPETPVAHDASQHEESCRPRLALPSGRPPRSSTRDRHRTAPHRTAPHHASTDPRRSPTRRTSRRGTPCRGTPCRRALADPAAVPTADAVPVAPAHRSGCVPPR